MVWLIVQYLANGDSLEEILRAYASLTREDAQACLAYAAKMTRERILPIRGYLLMRFKLDENADARWREPLEQAGYEVSTAAEESLQGVEDPIIAQTCRKLGLCLITADLDFCQIVDYPPEEYAGLIVLRHPHPTLAGMRRLVQQVALAVAQNSPAGQLWIVEPGRIRIHLNRPEEETS